MSNNKVLRSSDLIVPIYLDTYMLLDLIASIENGFSTIERVTTKTSSTETDDTAKRSLYAEFTIPNFFKFGANPAKKTTTTDGTDDILESDRYQTYGSLLYRLRNFLMTQALLKQFNSDEDNQFSTIQPSDFVELRGVFRPNPFIASLNHIDRLLEIYKSAVDFESTPASKGSQKKPSQNPGIQVIEKIRKFTNTLRLDLEHDGIKMFVIDMVGNVNSKAVATMFLQYFRDQSTSELAGKQFTLFGKVVQSFSKPNEAINLLSGTGFGSLSDETIEQFLAVFDGLRQQGITLPEITTKVSAPVLQIVPIAIYV